MEHLPNSYVNNHVWIRKSKTTTASSDSPNLNTKNMYATTIPSKMNIRIGKQKKGNHSAYHPDMHTHSQPYISKTTGNNDGCHIFVKNI